MDAERYARLKELFLQAIELPADDRPAFIDAACSDDPEMGEHLESLLAHHIELPRS